MSVFEIELRKRGVHVQSVREALRAAIAAVKDGTAESFFLHDVGVFHAVDTETRFTVFEEHVWRSLGDSKVKLRPPHVPATELTESNSVVVECTFGTDSQARNWKWESTSRAGDFTVITPTSFFGSGYKLHRVTGNGRSSYVLAESTMTAAQAAAVERVQFNGGNLKVEACHFTNSLLSFTEASPSTNDGDPGTPKWTVSVANNTGTAELNDPGDDGKEARAWIMQRAK